jgi:hypothetical protein
MVGVGTDDYGRPLLRGRLIGDGEVDGPEITALIGEEPQSLLRCVGWLSNNDRLLVGNSIDSVDERGPYVFGREARVGVEKVLFCGSFGELPQHELHGDPGTPNDGLSQHHPGIQLDSIRRRHDRHSAYTRCVPSRPGLGSGAAQQPQRCHRLGSQQVRPTSTPDVGF